MLRAALTVVVLTTSLTACDRFSAKGEQADVAAAPAKLLLAPEDILRIAPSTLTSGPPVSGSIQPERRADLRAEVSSVVLHVLKDNGDAVRRGDVLVRLDQTAILDSLSSAQDSARNAALSLDQAARNVQRLETLRTSGMTSLQALDDAEVRRNAAQSELSAATTRLALARQQLERTIVRAPFDGVVSERKVSAGDTAGIGKELLKVIDPASMRFAGRVSADRISQVAVGQNVSFRINGYATQAFRGKVTRVDPSANDVTRQIEVLVGFSDAVQPRVAGLFAEGVIESGAVTALIVPESALHKAGDRASVWRLRQNVLNRVDLTLGARDPRTGSHEVLSGLGDGDIIVRIPGAGLRNGQRAELAASPAPSGAAAGIAPGRGG